MHSPTASICRISARCRRLDDHRFTGIDDCFVAALQLFDAAVLATYGILADLAGFAAGKTEWPLRGGWPDRMVQSIFSRKRIVRIDAVARIPFAAPAGTFADVKILKHDRIAIFQNFRIGEPRIGHVGLHRIGAGEAGPAGEPEQIVS